MRLVGAVGKTSDTKIRLIPRFQVMLAEALLFAVILFVVFIDAGSPEGVPGGFLRKSMPLIFSLVAGIVYYLIVTRRASPQEDRHAI